MTKRLTAFALACFAMTGVSTATELAPMSGHSIRLGRFDGTVYYTVEHGGYRVVATLVAGAEDVPIRFVSTLTPEQRIVISVPQAVGEPSLDLEILRNGDALLVGDFASASIAKLASDAPTAASFSK